MNNWRNEELLRGIKGAPKIPSLTFQFPRSRAAPQNSFISIAWVDSNATGSTNFSSSFQSVIKILKGH
jgi:hypothetical protein